MLFTAAAAVSMTVCGILAAHQPSKIDHVTLITIDGNGLVRLSYKVWWGDLYSVYLRSDQIDSDQDKVVTEEEKDSFRIVMEEQYAANLKLFADGSPVPLKTVGSRIECEGKRYVPSAITLTISLEADLGAFPSKITFHDDNEVDTFLIGENDVQITVPPGVGIASKSARTMFSGALVTGGEFVFEGSPDRGAGRVEAPPLPPPPPLPSPGYDPLKELLTGMLAGERGFFPLAFALFVAAWLGAGHALSPGHGKAMVAGYLVGSRGRVMDAVFLGLVVTLTHISSVVVLGLLMLALSGVFRQERVFPWMTVVSGFLVFAIGLSIIARAIRAALGRERKESHSHGFWIFRHSHEHGTHGHDHGTASAPEEKPKRFVWGPVTRIETGSRLLAIPSVVREYAAPDPSEKASTCKPAKSRLGTGWKDLLLLGISGGMVPCPSALVVLLASIAFDAAWAGLLLIAAFSIGLAAVLVGIGVSMVAASGIASRAGPGAVRIARVLPIFSGAAVTIVGAVIAAKGLAGLLQRL